MTAYDRQVILAMASGDDPVAADGIDTAARALQDKAASRGLASSVVPIPAGAAPKPLALAALTQDSRLIIVGALDASGGQVAGREPAALAGFLAASGLRAVRRISLVADTAGHAPDTDGPPGPDLSFAGRFHAALREEHGIETELTARIGEVTVVAEGPDRGRKQTRTAEDPQWAHKRPRSKVVYAWSGTDQTRRWSDED